MIAAILIDPLPAAVSLFFAVWATAFWIRVFSSAANQDVRDWLREKFRRKPAYPEQETMCEFLNRIEAEMQESEKPFETQYKGLDDQTITHEWEVQTNKKS